MDKEKSCLFCMSKNGYYVTEVVYRNLFFDYNNDGASEDMTDYFGKRRRCVNCHRILPKKMFNE